MLNIYLDSYSIIGEESQTIQIILNKNEKININKKYLISASSEDITENLYKNVDFITLPGSERVNKDLQKVDNPQIVNLKNKNANIEYVSLSRGGKIMKIMPSFYNDLYIRLDSLLAFNNGIELYTDRKIDEDTKFFRYKYLIPNYIHKLSRTNLLLNNYDNQRQFCLIKTKLNNEFEENNFDNLVNSFLFNKTNLINDMVFISGKNNLYEKRLGEGESMILLGESLLAFEGSISFRPIKEKKENNKYVNKLNDIIIDGPGMIIFEPCERIIPMVNNKKYGLIAIIIIILILQVIFHLIVFNGRLLI
jgi:hypothetical protein